MQFNNPTSKNNDNKNNDNFTLRKTNRPLDLAAYFPFKTTDLSQNKHD
jgi:hypothetical protein